MTPRRSFVVAVGLAAACSTTERATRDSGTAGATVATPAAPVSSAPESVLAVQMGAFSESGNARRMRDSLSGAGWIAYLRGGTGKGVPAVQVRIAASRDSILPRLVVASLGAARREAVVVRAGVGADSVTRTTVIPVSTGSHGMSASTRWALAGDRRALLVVEDPTAVEGEPVPDGFLLADESSGAIVQRDSVWDIAPSPNWRRIAVGIAYVLPGRERDRIPTAEWSALARRSGLTTDSVHAAAFQSSGMSTAYGLAQPAVYDLSVAPVNGARAAVVLPMAGGWRIGWSAAGDALLVGTNPKRAGDDEPASGWMAVDLRGKRVGDAGDTPAPVAWTEGPTLDVGVPVDFVSAHTIAAGNRSIESAAGWIRVREGTTSRIVGPGTALVATATGRFVAALVPDASGKPGDSSSHPARLVVYDLGR